MVYGLIYSRERALYVVSRVDSCFCSVGGLSLLQSSQYGLDSDQDEASRSPRQATDRDVNQTKQQQQPQQPSSPSITATGSPSLSGSKSPSSGLPVSPMLTSTTSTYDPPSSPSSPIYRSASPRMSPRIMAKKPKPLSVNSDDGYTSASDPELTPRRRSGRKRQNRVSFDDQKAALEEKEVKTREADRQRRKAQEGKPKVKEQSKRKAEKRKQRKAEAKLKGSDKPMSQSQPLRLSQDELGVRLGHTNLIESARDLGKHTMAPFCSYFLLLIACVVCLVWYSQCAKEVC